MQNEIRCAYLLAGGQSQRFGRDKATALVQGVPLIVSHERMLRNFELCTTLVVQKPEDYSEYGIRTIVDGVDQAGPLAGLVAALRDARQRGEDWSVVLNCDLIAWQDAWLGCWRRALRSAEGAWDAIVFAADSFLPLPGLYASRGLEAAEAQLRSEDKSLRGLFDRLGNRAHAIEIQSELLPCSFNTVAEYQALLEQIETIVDEDMGE